jgi:hypothetical protein
MSTGSREPRRLSIRTLTDDDAANYGSEPGSSADDSTSSQRQYRQ